MKRDRVRSGVFVEKRLDGVVETIGVSFVSSGKSVNAKTEKEEPKKHLAAECAVRKVFNTEADYLHCYMSNEGKILKVPKNKAAGR